MKSKSIAESGLFVALTLAILYLAAYLPVSTITILTAVSCIIPIAMIRNDIKYSFLIYIASSILSFLLIPIKISLSYILFFGLYGIIKHYIEKINNLYVEIPLKLLSFNIILFSSYFVLNSLIINISNINIPLWSLFLAAQIVFLIYDYALTLIITMYINKH